MHSQVPPKEISLSFENSLQDTMSLGLSRSSKRVAHCPLLDTVCKCITHSNCVWFSHNVDSVLVHIFFFYFEYHGFMSSNNVTLLLMVRGPRWSMHLEGCKYKYQIIIDKWADTFALIL